MGKFRKRVDEEEEDQNKDDLGFNSLRVLPKLNNSFL